MTAVRELVGVVALALAAGCAVGGDGSMVTSFGVSSVSSTGTGASTTDASTAGSEPTGSIGSGTTDIASVDDTVTSSSPTSGDTEPVQGCAPELQTFAADPGWEPLNLPDQGNVFAWVQTANAGGGAGEIGGTLQRAGVDQYFADTSIQIATGECISAQGRLVAPSEASDFNSIINFGHFSRSGGPHVGFSFGEHDGSTLRVFLVAGSLSQQVFLLEAIATPRTWSYEYDPTTGMMTLEIEGLGSQSVPVAPGDVEGIEGIDAFGMFKTPHDTPEMYPGLLEAYLDEISYTR